MLVKINFCGQIRAIIHALHARPILVKKIKLFSRRPTTIQQKIYEYIFRQSI